MSDDQVRTRLRKLLELARRGVGGEKVTAEKFLNKLLAKHGMTIDELEDAGAKKIVARFKYTSQLERKLIVQIVCCVTQRREILTGKKPGRGGAYLLAELTPGQEIEAKLMFAALLPALKKQADLMFSAFVSKNRIFSNEEREDDEEESTLSREDEYAIAMMMTGMQRTVVPRGALTHGSAP